MPELHLLWIAQASPEIAALGRRLKGLLDHALHPVATPAVALAVGAAWSDAAHLAKTALPVVMAGLIFCAVVTAAPGRISRAESVRAAAILHVCMLVCPAAIAACMVKLGFDPALTCAGTMIACSPVSMGSGVVAEQLGLPGRPMVWAAVMGVAVVPFNLPLVAAASGAPGLPAPGALAAAALAIAGLPLFAALSTRRLVPRGTEAWRPLLRRVVIICLAVLACSAGGRTLATLSRPGGGACCAMAFGIQAFAAGLAWSIGRSFHGLSPTLAPQLALASSMRNTSLVWAACLAAGGMGPTTESVVSTFVALTFVSPVLAASCAAAKRRYSASAPEMISISSRVMLAWRVRL